MFGWNVAVEEENERKTARFDPEEKQEHPNKKNQVPRAGNLSAKRVGRRCLGRTRGCPEDRKPQIKWILDPGGNVALMLNWVFLISCLASICIDPLFFFLPLVENYGNYSCVRSDQNLSTVLTSLRSLIDVFYMMHIIIKFHTVYVSPSSRVLGKGELVMDHRKISGRYIRSGFLIDLVGALPFPQIFIWMVTPAIGFDRTDTPFLLVILIQFAIRLYFVIPLSNRIIKVAGFLAKIAWGGTVYNLLLYMLASHVIGAIYYLLAIERQTTCWQSQCLLENGSPDMTPCEFKYLDCDFLRWSDGQTWANSTSIFTNCDANNNGIAFNYGIYSFALQYGVVSTSLSEKYFYCLWWGFQQLSTYGNPLMASSCIGENLFAIGLTTLSLGLFAQLIGSIQIYIRSISTKREEWRLKQRDNEEWMKDHQLPHELQERVGQFLQYKWIATQGVDEESILKDLPADLRRDIQHHLCLDLVHRVPFFSEMDDQLLGALCEYMNPFLCIDGTYIIREGDPVTEMLFIIRGKLESSTTDGGRTDFFNSIILRPGDFCGEDLLTWALLANSITNYPSSTRTVRTLVALEAFALRAEDLKFVAAQFRRLHSKRLQHTFRFYSYQWRTWAACFIQAAWRRHSIKRMKKDQSSRWEPFFSLVEEEVDGTRSSSSISDEASLPVTKIASIFRKPRSQKPEEPGFSANSSAYSMLQIIFFLHE
ncbi:cyclic nucleotide-gated ion channel 17-like [Typha latifolia]|uniref:cyclic nucleotide-gated ion channel 17-like n=1 Tax=Typha latifolia TaxID=4733 RepID=UPI003C2DCBF6